MISATSSLSPYTAYPVAPNRAQMEGKPRGPEEEPVPEDGALSEVVRKNSPQAQTAEQDPAKAAQEQRLIDELKKTDRAVRAHEQAHLAAAGGLAVSGATFGYQRGPDGQRYAVSGEVSIDVSPGRTPQETMAKADRIRAAALAPADPSAQDRAVASQAAQMKLQAQQQQAQLEREALGNSGKEMAGEDSGIAARINRIIAGYGPHSGAPSPPPGSIVNAAA
jgi:hypothetical protein